MKIIKEIIHIIVLLLFTIKLIDSNHLRYNIPTTFCNEVETLDSGFLNGLFYIFYESSNNVKNKKDIPIVLWLSGGPGCSGLVGAYFENGPCLVLNDANPIQNEYSWTNEAHMIYLDQPQGTGFSPFNNSNNKVYKWTEEVATNDIIEFLSLFFQKYKQFNQNNFYIFGESYAGHYVPDVAYKILKNKNKNKDINIFNQLKGIAIGNGIISPENMYDTLIDFALNNSYNVKLLDENNHKKMNHFKSLVKSCLRIIKNCQKGEIFCQNTSSCVEAFDELVENVHKLNKNHFDIRKSCESDPSHQCYHFKYLRQYLNKPDIRDLFGLNDNDNKWDICNKDVWRGHLQSDWYAETEYKIPELLDNHIKVLIYAGNADLLCNSFGQEKWTSSLNWKKRDDFNQIPLKDWIVDKKVAGQSRSINGFTFLRVYDSGHMVPHDQPKNSLEMLRTYLNNETL